MNTTARALRYQSQFDRCLSPHANRFPTKADTNRAMQEASDRARRDARRAKQDRGVAR